MAPTQTSQLEISKQLKLPLEAVTQTFAILAKRGVGKSFTADVLAEELLSAGQQVVILDPTGAHWGLRSSSDGKKPGYPIVVFGGDHGDLPLDVHAGETIAQAVVEHRFPAIIDLSHFRKGETNRFGYAFLETLYRKNRDALHLIVDEADTFAPQRLDADQARVCGAMEDVVKKGRIRGLGCTLITQRPAVLNKNVLTQCESLFAMRLTHPRDIDAIREWVAVHAEPEEERRVVKDLPTLNVGTGYFWSPGWLGVLERITIRKKRTFDSGMTPKPGESRVVPKTLAQVDLDRLGKQIQATAEQAKSDDPKALKRTIAELQRQLETRPAVEPERIEVPAISPCDIEGLYETVGTLTEQLQRTERLLTNVRLGLEQVRSGTGVGVTPAKPPSPMEWGKRFESLAHKGPVSTKREPPGLVKRAAHPAAKPASSGSSNLGKGEHAVLTAIAQHTDGVTLDQITVLTGYKRSSRNTYLQRLSSSGLVDKSTDRITVTDAGLAALGDDFEPLPTGKALRAYWLQRLPEGERRCLEIILCAHPHPVDKERLSGETGYKRSSRNTYLQRLRSRKLIVDHGGSVAAAESLS